MLGKAVIYEGAKHGFAVRTNPPNDGQMKSANEAKEQGLSLFGFWMRYLQENSASACRRI